jgi:hypothetical protein
MAAMCSGVLPQQPPMMFTKPDFAKSVAKRHVRRQQIEARRRERVRHARVRIRRHKAIRLRREFFEERAHLVRPERAVQADDSGFTCRIAFHSAST